MAELSFDKLIPVRLSEQIASQIEALILENHLRPGDKLPSERELSASFGVSRPVVRESIKFLEERGLVMPQSGRGAFVTDPGSRNITSSLNLAYQMQACTADDFHEARWCMESYTARLAAERATEEDISRMAEAIRVMDTSLDNPEKFMVADAEFHAALAASTHNPLFPAMTSPLVEMILKLGHVAFSHGGFRDRHQKHMGILDAIKRRDASAAEEAMHGHLNLSKEAFSSMDPVNIPTTGGHREKDRS